MLCMFRSGGACHARGLVGPAISPRLAIPVGRRSSRGGKKLRPLLEDAVSAHLIADVPVACFFQAARPGAIAALPLGHEEESRASR